MVAAINLKSDSSAGVSAVGSPVQSSSDSLSDRKPATPAFTSPVQACLNTAALAPSANADSVSA